MGSKEPVSSSLSKVDIRQMIEQLEDAKRLLGIVGTEFLHLQHDVAHARSLLTGLVFALEKPDQRRSEVDEDEDTLDYEDWVATQPWPEGATHATLDRQGGVIWWKRKPVLAPAREYGWKERYVDGDLIERYYDPAQPFSGPKWRESLREKPTENE